MCKKLHSYLGNMLNLKVVDIYLSFSCLPDASNSLYMDEKRGVLGEPLNWLIHSSTVRAPQNCFTSPFSCQLCRFYSSIQWYEYWTACRSYSRISWPEFTLLTIWRSLQTELYERMAGNQDLVQEKKQRERYKHFYDIITESGEFPQRVINMMPRSAMCFLKQERNLSSWFWHRDARLFFPISAIWSAPWPEARMRLLIIPVSFYPERFYESIICIRKSWWITSLPLENKIYP